MIIDYVLSLLVAGLVALYIEQRTRTAKLNKRCDALFDSFFSVQRQLTNFRSIFDAQWLKSKYDSEWKRITSEENAAKATCPGDWTRKDNLPDQNETVDEAATPLPIPASLFRPEFKPAPTLPSLAIIPAPVLSPVVPVPVKPAPIIRPAPVKTVTKPVAPIAPAPVTAASAMRVPDGAPRPLTLADLRRRAESLTPKRSLPPVAKSPPPSTSSLSPSPSPGYTDQPPPIPPRGRTF